MTSWTESAQNPRTGGCLCGAVRYRIDGPLADVLNCHCERCRRTSGHEWSMHAGCLDDTAGLTTTANWFAHEAGSYFRLDPHVDRVEGNG